MNSNFFFIDFTMMWVNNFLPRNLALIIKYSVFSGSCWQIGGGLLFFDFCFRLLYNLENIRQ